jgi:hypothetical protein
MKRKNENENIMISAKRQKIVQRENLWDVLDTKVQEDSIWISATKTKNYLLKDPVIDWLEKYYLKIGFGDKNINYRKINRDKQNISQEMDIMKNTLFKKGNEFEEKIYQELDKMTNCVSVINNYTECSIEKMQDTIKYMQEGVPIIKQAVLYNESNRTFGIADLLIRSDYINKLFTDNIEHITNYEETIGCKFSDNYHYRIIDIKWAQLQLCSNGFKILNTDRYPAYKGQLAIYNLALGKIQDYIPNIAYILGKSYKYECKSKIYYGLNSFDRLGQIQYNDFDSKYIELTKKAIDWYRDMLVNGSMWNIITNNKIELCPNMCNTADTPYSDIKQELARKRFELTSIWRVGVKNRELAYNNNVFNWMDSNCNSTVMGIPKTTSTIVDNIITINKNPTVKYYPSKISSNMYEWRDNKNYIDFFIDFETINDIFYKDSVTINNNKNMNYIFMFGVGYFDINNKWIFKEFHMDKLNNQEELITMNQFKDYINEKFEERKILSTNKIRFFHWSAAETSFLESFNNKNNDILASFLSQIDFADLYKLFITEPICISGCTTFKLKDISKALYNLGLIKSTWKNIDVANGLTAMLDGCLYYKSIENNTKEEKMDQMFQNIIMYNEVDCKVMGEIVNWMRTCL